MTDLRGADSLLQKAIEKVEDGKKLDTAQVITRTGSPWDVWGWMCCRLRTRPDIYCWGLFFVIAAGSPAMHRGAEGVDERGAGRRSTGQSAEGGRGRPGQNETRRPQVPTVRRLQVDTEGPCSVLCFKVLFLFITLQTITLLHTRFLGLITQSTYEWIMQL